MRAIHFAKRFIYLENQYFTNEAITQALIAALKANEELQLILVVPVEPDIPRYPHWQRGLIQRIATVARPDAESRFGAFTLLSHAAPDAAHAKARLRANYAHTKSAIIDNNWATVGSANSTARRSTSSSSSSTGGCRTSSSRPGELQHRDELASSSSSKSPGRLGGRRAAPPAVGGAPRLS